MGLLTWRLAGLVALAAGGSGRAWAQGPVRPAELPPAPSEEQSYRKELVYGLNFNTQGALIGGVAVRSARVENDRWLRFWQVEAVMLKNPKERQVSSGVGGVYIARKTNYAFVLRPSYGVQRILFRKAADAGVQVNGLLSAGPSLGLLLPYYITYDRTAAQTGSNIIYPATDEIVDEQYDPYRHNEQYILDRGPLFSGLGNMSLAPGLHLRGGLSFEYGRYRDAVAGVEAGFLLEAFTRRITILSPDVLSDVDNLNKQFFPSVYLTLYFGQRS